MSEEEKAQNVLPCGHVDSFGHSLVMGLLVLVQASMSAGIDPVEPCLQYAQAIFQYYYVPVPSVEEMGKIEVSKTQETKEVH
jgi:hypothetical protein